MTFYAASALHLKDPEGVAPARPPQPVKPPAMDAELEAMGLTLPNVFFLMHVTCRLGFPDELP